jgi:predicted 2-oxoglutarate/Fe(II)-dependent dioxygenase YbiX/peroxiredoxin
VLCFFGSAADPMAREALGTIAADRNCFDDDHACFFGVSLDPADEAEGRVKQRLPGIRFFWDFDSQIGRLYGVLPDDAKAGESGLGVLRAWLILDPTLRVLARFPFEQQSARAVLDYLAQLPPPDRFAGMEVQAPVLPNVFEPEFCQKLVDLYESHGGEESGFMRERDGKTIHGTDPSHKRRKDHIITDQAIIGETQSRIRRRIKPEVRKAHQFEVTRMERYIVACYSSEDGAHFAPHRDNTTKGTAHRRFAVSINLNEDFDGEEVVFPEYGSRRFKMPTGGAVVFSCSLLHVVTKVTRGRRFAFLPFLYDEAAAKVREANNAYLGEGVGQYRTE